jgi:hypothetical protein
LPAGWLGEVTPCLRHYIWLAGSARVVEEEHSEVTSAG